MNNSIKCNFFSVRPAFQARLQAVIAEYSA